MNERRATVPLSIFILVVGSSFFQAWWNFRLKKAPVDRSAFLLVSWFLFGCVATPVSIFFIDKPFEWHWLYFILATGVAQALYLLALSWAYSLSNMTLVFPISRGAAVGLTTFILFFLHAAEVSIIGWLGIAAIAMGAISLGRVDLKTKNGRKGLLASLLIAAIVMSYSVIDTFGADQVPIVFYVVIMNITAPLLALPFVYHRRRADLAIAIKNYKRECFWVGFAGSGTYLIVLWTFKYASPAYILALREVSIVFAVFLGVIFLKESLSKEKALGIVLILFGIVCIKLA